MSPEKNAYEAGTQKVIPAVLLYAFHGGKTLMIHRNSNPNDDHLGKWNGLGGKLEKNESPRECAVREFLEEAGCITSPVQWKWMGQLHFPDFKPHKHEDWSVTVFTCTLSDEQVGQVLQKTNEGTLSWIPSPDVLQLNLWPGDRHFLPYILSGNPCEGTFHYVNGILDRYLCESIFR
jgi:8-oxo-dGTP diphosphatase